MTSNAATSTMIQEFEMSGIKYVCSDCGWVSHRKMGNNKPCPKCGGLIYYHEADKSIVVVTIIAMVGLAIVMAALTGNG